MEGSEGSASRLEEGKRRKDGEKVGSGGKRNKGRKE